MTLRQYISLVSPSQSWEPLTPAERARILACGIAGLDVRLGTPGEADAISSALASGLEATGTAWVGKRGADGAAAVSEIVGIQQGRYWGDYCNRFKLRRFRANAERDVWRGPISEATGKATMHPAALEYLQGFALAFRHAAPSVELRYAGFAVPGWHYPGAAISDDVQGLFAGVDVMAYQSSINALRGTLERARHQWPRHDMGAFVGVGRLDGDDVIGNADAWVRLVRERAAKVTSIIHYVGNGAASQLLQGHARHRSVVEQVAALDRAAKGPEVCA